MKFSCVNKDGLVIAIVDADNAEQALNRGKGKNAQTTRVEERKDEHCEGAI